MSNVMKIIWKKRYKQRKLRQERNGHKILQVMLLVLEVSSPDMLLVLPFCSKDLYPLPEEGPVDQRLCLLIKESRYFKLLQCYFQESVCRFD